MSTAITVLHIVASVLLIISVLLQAGKGAEIGATFAGSSQTLFGASGAAPFLAKLTGAFAAIFMITSFTLTYLGAKSHSRSVFDTGAAPVTQQPANPETPAVPSNPAAPQAPAQEAPKP